LEVVLVALEVEEALAVKVVVPVVQQQSSSRSPTSIEGLGSRPS